MHGAARVVLPQRNRTATTPLSFSSGEKAASTSSLTPNETWDLCVNLSIARNRCLPGLPCAQDNKVRVAVDPAHMHSYYNISDTLLPNHLRPYHYDVELKPDFYSENKQNFHFSGNVTMYLKCIKDTDTIVFHRRFINIDQSSILIYNLHNRKLQKFTHVTADERREFYKIHLQRNLTTGIKYSVRMRFADRIHQGVHGLYLSVYRLKNQTRYLVGTQLQATRARQVFPCLDEPALKATFTVTVLRRDNYTALSNMPAFSEQDRGSGWTAVQFGQSPVMSTYLVAIVVSDFTYKEQVSSRGHKIRYWAPRHVIDQVDFAADIGGRMLDYFEELFDERHIVPKNDLTVIPDFDAGAMENWGLITFRELRLLVDAEYTSSIDQQQVAGTIAHELVHMWIGNIVTCHWWDDLWLNEGFARYFQYFGVQHVKPEWDMEQYFLMQRMHTEMDTDSYALMPPVYREVRLAAEAERMFRSTVYNKGASIIRMLVYVMSEEKLIQAVQAFIKKFRFKTANHSDLYEILEKYQDGTFPGSIRSFLDSWTKQLGYPVVTVNTSHLPGHVTVTQELFLLQEPSPDPVENSRFYNPSQRYTWDIPLSYVTDTSPTWDTPNRVWLYGESATFNLTTERTEPRWLVANVKQLGFFRVNYDERNWAALTSQLMEDHTVIDVINRAQIIDDAFALARSGRLDAVTAFKLTQYLRNETSFLPWYEAHHRLIHVETLVLGRTAAFGLFRHYMFHLMQPLYDDLGWEPRPADTQSTVYLRLNTLDRMCHLGHFGCQLESLKRFHMWMKDPDNMRIINPDLRRIVYCNAIKKSSFDEWNFLMRRFRRERHPKERALLRDALACSREPWILQLYLKMSKWSLPMEVPYIFEAVAKNPIGQPILWQHIKDNWQHMPGLPIRLRELSQLLSSKDDLDNYLEIESAVQYGISLNTHNEIIRTIRMNIEWREKNERPLAEWLETIVMEKLRGNYFHFDAQGA